MRLWSLHPSMLDRVGLVALWREGLLAQHVLEGRTKGYKNHPQLERFKMAADPINDINYYLSVVVDEATMRGYVFNKSKLATFSVPKRKIDVSLEQLTFEFQHLLAKCKQRDRVVYESISHLSPLYHPLFNIVDGPIASWERTS